MKEKLPGETIAVYGEILQGIPFYTKERVMLIDSMGELELEPENRRGRDGSRPRKNSCANGSLKIARSSL